jgi:hypothetical protein
LPVQSTGARTTGAIGSAIPECPYYGCLISRLYNTVRLHSAIGFVTPADMLAGRQKEIQEARDRKLEEARRQPQLRRQATGGMRTGVTWLCQVKRKRALRGRNHAEG